MPKILLAKRIWVPRIAALSLLVSCSIANPPTPSPASSIGSETCGPAIAAKSAVRGMYERIIQDYNEKIMPAECSSGEHAPTLCADARNGYQAVQDAYRADPILRMSDSVANNNLDWREWVKELKRTQNSLAFWALHTAPGCERADALRNIASQCAVGCLKSTLHSRADSYPCTKGCYSDPQYVSAEDDCQKSAERQVKSLDDARQGVLDAKRDCAGMVYSP